MTTNAYIFSWCCEGIEAIVPITQYQLWDQENLIRILKDEPEKPNPLNNILNMLTMRARFNSHRFYEIYAVECHPDLSEEFWKNQWESYPQKTANLIREKGVKIYSDRIDHSNYKIL
jgi:hypothetical protein